MAIVNPISKTSADAAYATAAQGATADTAATQDLDNLSSTGESHFSKLQIGTTAGTALAGDTIIPPMPHNYDRVYYVDPKNTATSPDGTIDNPYATIADLIAAHGLETSVLVYLRDTDSLALDVDNLADWTFSGFLATKDAGRTNVDAIQLGANTTGIYIIGIVCNSTYNDLSTLGNNYLRYCTIKGITTISNTAYSCFELSTAEGEINVTDGTFDFLNSSTENSVAMSVTGGTVIITNGRAVSLIQSAGTVLAMGATIFSPQSGGSLYAVTQTGGNLVILSGDAVDPSTGAPAPIQLAGGVYALGTLSYDAMSSIAGTEILNGLQARQVADTQTFTNIVTTPANDTRQSKINLAIDTLLGTIKATADSALASATSSKVYKGQMLFAADTAATVSTIPTTGLAIDDTCFICDTYQTYTWNGTAWSISLVPLAGTIGDQYDIVRYYGAFHGTSFTGNATAVITCSATGTVLPTLKYDLIVSESTPVDQDTIQTVDGVNQIAERTVNSVPDATPFADGSLPFGDFFGGTTNKINTLQTNLGLKQDKLSATGTGFLKQSTAAGTPAWSSIAEADITNLTRDLAYRDSPYISIAGTDYATELLALLIPYGLNTNDGVWFNSVGNNLGVPSNNTCAFYATLRGSPSTFTLYCMDTRTTLHWYCNTYTSTISKPVWVQALQLPILNFTATDYYTEILAALKVLGLTESVGSTVTFQSTGLQNGTFPRNTLWVVNVTWFTGSQLLFNAFDTTNGGVYHSSIYTSTTAKPVWNLFSKVPNLTFTGTDYHTEIFAKSVALGLAANGDEVTFTTIPPAAWNIPRNGYNCVVHCGGGNMLYFRITNLLTQATYYCINYNDTTAVPVWTPVEPVLIRNIDASVTTGVLRMSTIGIAVSPTVVKLSNNATTIPGTWTGVGTTSLTFTPTTPGNITGGDWEVLVN